MLRINPLTSYVVAIARDQIQNKTKQSCDLKILNVPLLYYFPPCAAWDYPERKSRVQLLRTARPTQVIDFNVTYTCYNLRGKTKKSDSVSSRVLTRQQQQDRRDGTGLPVCAELWFPCGYLYECVWSPVAVLSDAASSVSFGCVLLSPLSVQECERPCLWIHFHKEGIRPPQKRKINRSALHGYPDDHSKGFRYFGHCANPTSLYQISVCVCVQCVNTTVVI